MHSKLLFDHDETLKTLLDDDCKNSIGRIKALDIEEAVFPLCPYQWHRGWKDVVGFVDYNKEIESMYAKR
jgi:hypothetical protein